MFQSSVAGIFSSANRGSRSVCFAAAFAVFCAGAAAFPGQAQAQAPAPAPAQTQAVPPAHADPPTDEDVTIEAITRLNKRALEEYDNLNFDRAEKTLNEALELCRQKNLDNHPIKARTLVHLGVVILATGQAQRPEAIKQFQKALGIQPDIKLTTRVANPEVQSAFDEAGKTLVANPPAADSDQTGAPAGDAEPEPPSEGIAHDAITSAARRSVIPVSVTTDPSLGAKKVVLAYRSDGAPAFEQLELKEYSAGNWSGSIPDTATAGKQVAYSISVENERGEPVGNYGSPAAPLVIKLKNARVAQARPRPPEGQEPEEPEPTSPSENPTWLLGIGVGSGFGYASGYGDVNDQDKVQSGFGAAKLGHVLPEIGYFVSPNTLLSLQLRIQSVSGATSIRDPSGTTCGATNVCEPAKGALAAFAKITWLFGRGPFLPYLAASVGAGQIRHLASFPGPNNTNCGAKGGSKCVDTVSAGPILLGPGVGFIVNATPTFGFTLGVNSLIAFTHFTFHVDVNAGILVQL